MGLGGAVVWALEAWVTEGSVGVVGGEIGRAARCYGEWARTSIYLTGVGRWRGVSGEDARSGGVVSLVEVGGNVGCGVGVRADEGVIQGR